MDNSDELVLNIVLPEEIGRQIQSRPIDGFNVEEIVPAGAQQTTRFGVVEVVTLVTLVSGVLSAIQTCLEIRKLLKEQEEKTGMRQLAVKLSTPDERVELTITAQLKEEEVEKLVKEAFAQAGIG